MINIRECPFCGADGNNIDVRTKWSRHDCYSPRTAYAYCKHCHARGPIVKSDSVYDVRNERPGNTTLIMYALVKWNGGVGGANGGLPLFEGKQKLGGKE